MIKNGPIGVIGQDGAGGRSDKPNRNSTRPVEGRGRVCDTHRVPWELDSLTVGWPPQLTLKRVPKDEKALHPLFVFLADKRLLRYGYGTQAGIASLDDLANRVDAIRAELFAALTALRPDAPIAEWLRKLEEAAHELLTKTYAAMSERATTAPEPADIAPAVNQLRDAFGWVAEHVFDVYRLPAARNLADQIRKDIQ